jgi:enoyl-CoA hydratase/carnithine racemase
MTNVVRSSLVRISKDNDVAVITIDNPPVNALRPGVPEGIGAAIDEMNRDPAIKAAVVIGGGRTFVAGADIKEFGKMTSGGPRRSLLPLLLHIEDSPKPVMMTIHGTAFGGVLELAMAGHYRVASPTAQVGHPEVKLGIIPGAAGTQRLPRLVGVTKAVEMCAEGKPVSAGEAATLGLIDALIEGDLLAGAVSFAREAAGKPTPKTRERTKKLGTAAENEAVFTAARDAAVDKALVDFGNAMGPLATGDLAGLDVGWRTRQEYRQLEKPGIRQPFAEDRLCEMGRYGQKTTKGWYRYDENRRASSDTEVTALVRKWSAEAGIRQRQISAEEIVDRCIYALVNEGARILEEGYALRAVDIDIIYLNGYGFPAHRGGPMWYADTVGLQKVYQRICEFHQQHGEPWEPAPLLRRLAEEKRTFADFDKARVAAA